VRQTIAALDIRVDAAALNPLLIRHYVGNQVLDIARRWSVDGGASQSVMTGHAVGISLSVRHVNTALNTVRY